MSKSLLISISFLKKYFHKYKIIYSRSSLVAREGVSWDIRDKNALLIEFQFHRQKMWVTEQSDLRASFLNIAFFKIFYPFIFIAP